MEVTVPFIIPCRLVCLPGAAPGGPRGDQTQRRESTSTPPRPKQPQSGTLPRCTAAAHTRVRTQKNRVAVSINYAKTQGKQVKFKKERKSWSAAWRSGLWHNPPNTGESDRCGPIAVGFPWVDERQLLHLVSVLPTPHGFCRLSFAQIRYFPCFCSGVPADRKYVLYYVDLKTLCLWFIMGLYVQWFVPHYSLGRA